MSPMDCKATIQRLTEEADELRRELALTKLDKLGADGLRQLAELDRDRARATTRSLVIALGLLLVAGTITWVALMQKMFA